VGKRSSSSKRHWTLHGAGGWSSLHIAMSDPAESPSRRSRTIVGQLARSEIYRDYERAFRDATGLPLSLRAVEAFDLPHQGEQNESPFCALMTTSNQSCAACLQFQRKVEESAGLELKTLKCFAGLCDSAVPIRVGQDLIAFLQTGQILLHKPSKRSFPKLHDSWSTGCRHGSEAGGGGVFSDARADQSPVRFHPSSPGYFRAASGVAQQPDHRAGREIESPQITRARAFITEHQDEDVSLSEVAKAVNMSAFYFCKMFKQATGLTFTDYLARIRVEKVKKHAARSAQTG